MGHDQNSSKWGQVETTSESETKLSYVTEEGKAIFNPLLGKQQLSFWC